MNEDLTLRNPVIDGHVHLYDCFNLSDLLDAAYANFKAEARRQGIIDRYAGILLLTETSKDHWFQRLSDGADGDTIVGQKILGKWQISRLPEDNCSLLARHESGKSIIFIAGRQIVTAEGLEVLALATEKTFSDGLPIEDVLQNIQRAGAVPVIPWGVGKWLGGRGKILSRVLASEANHGLSLGDNGGRPVFWRNPSHFKQAHEAGIRILPGSDPLPMQPESSRIGSFGFTINAPISTTHPAREIRRLLLNPSVKITPYGRLQGPFRFLRNQLSIRLARPSQSTEIL